MEATMTALKATSAVASIIARGVGIVGGRAVGGMQTEGAGRWADNQFTVHSRHTVIKAQG